MATTSVRAPCCMAGITFSTAIFAAPKTPHLTFCIGDLRNLSQSWGAGELDLLRFPPHKLNQRRDDRGATTIDARYDGARDGRDRNGAEPTSHQTGDDARGGA